MRTRERARTGRPSLDPEDDTVQVTCRVPGRTATDIRRLAAEQGRRQADIIRDALVIYLGDSVKANP